MMKCCLIKNITTMFVITIGIVASAFSQVERQLIHYENDGNLKYMGSHVYKGISVPYKLRIPDDSAAGHPIMIALHGGSGSGNITNPDQFKDKHWFANAWIRDSVQAEFPNIFIFPQKPSSQGGWSTANLEAVMHLVDSIAVAWEADTNRIYVSGISMGGRGTYTSILNYPNKFAAAVVFAGRTNDMNNLDKVLHLPLWAFHGTVDNIVEVEGARQVFDKFTELGRMPVYTDCDKNGNNCDGLSSEEKDIVADTANLIFSEYATGKHVITRWVDWERLVPWVFSKRKGSKPVATTITRSKGSRLIKEAIQTYDAKGRVAPMNTAKTPLLTK